MRIVSWNILHGGGQRTDRIIEAVASQDADIVALQEFRNGKSGERLREGLTSLGLEEQFAPETQSARDNTLLLASCFNFEVDRFPQRDDVPGSEQRCLQATFRALPVAGLSRLEIIAVHLPHKKLQIPYFESMLALKEQSDIESTLMIGDFNCGIPFEDSETASFYATSYFQQLLRQGWTDAWRIRNPDAREFSWISTKKRNGFRYDHALTSSAINKMITDITYVHSVRESSISDHSMLCIDI